MTSLSQPIACVCGTDSGPATSDHPVTEASSTCSSTQHPNIICSSSSFPPPISYSPCSSPPCRPPRAPPPPPLLPPRPSPTPWHPRHCQKGRWATQLSPKRSVYLFLQCLFMLPRSALLNSPLLLQGGKTCAASPPPFASHEIIYPTLPPPSPQSPPVERDWRQGQQHANARNQTICSFFSLLLQRVSLPPSSICPLPF